MDINTTDELEKQIESMPPEVLQSTILKIGDVNDPHWEEKTRAAILGLNRREKLEIVGKSLSLHQLLYLMTNLLQIEDKHHWKLSPLLVGLPHQIFAKVLQMGTKNDMHILKHESVTEPVQHQLTLLSHDLTYQLNDRIGKADEIEREIETLDLENLSRSEVVHLMERIGTLAQGFKIDYETANSALGLAWNTNRLDLIESLNHVKDSCLKYCTLGTGKPSTNSSPATGLFLKLEERLFSVYGGPNDVEALSDEEPAMEGLAKFSVWYLRDYLGLGLLPGISSTDELDIDMGTHSDIERADYREKLFELATQTLAKHGLSTIKDLKRESIFSKKTLQEYLKSVS